MKSPELEERAMAEEQPGQKGIHLQRSVYIDASPDAIYGVWRNLANLPQFMQHLHAVEVLDEKRSHWIAKAPMGKVEWDAEIIEDVENEMISWQSYPSSDVRMTGTVHFQSGPDGRGTEVRVALQYDPPAGKLGAMAAKLLGKAPSQQVDADLHRLKALVESGAFAAESGS